MTSRVRVQLHQKPNGFVTIDAKATQGAVIGENVWLADGSLYVPAEPTTPETGSQQVLWELLLKVPANVRQVAALSTSGFVRREGSGTWTASPITIADLPSGIGGVPYFIEDGDTYTVPENTQALFALPIELEGTASLVIDGALVEVS